MKIKLMIVDDDEEFLTSVGAYFADKNDYEVVATATNGEEALEKLSAADPDVVLLDIVMPRLDGYGVLEKIGRERRVIVMSALSSGSFVTVSYTHLTLPTKLEV